MLRMLESAGERLLSLVVPQVRAGACYCYINYSGCFGDFVCRRCFHCSGGPSWCEPCELHCPAC